MTAASPDKPFDFPQAAFHFFIVFGRKPVAVLWVALWQVLLYAAVAAAAFMLIGGPYMQLISTAMTRQEMDPGEVLTLFAPIMLWAPVLALFGTAVALMAQGAWMRLLVRETVAPLIPFRFGADEFRLLGVNLLYVVLLMAGYILFAILFFVLAGAMGVGLAATGESPGLAAGMIGGLLTGLFIIAALCVWVFIAVKLSAAPALTIYDRGFRFIGAAGAVKGVFWWVLLTYIVVALIIFVLAMALGTVVQLIFLGALLPVIGQLAAMEQGPADPQVLFDMLMDVLRNPATVTMVVIGAVVSLFLQIFYEGMWHGVGAYVARRHRAGEAAAPAEGGETPQTE
ncbi:MAG: hypothetical protein KIS81_10665 [Maricaulaceae bacterium]|nr:hypothetical protein [Maricaulaceae bacterium]